MRVAGAVLLLCVAMLSASKGEDNEHVFTLLDVVGAWGQSAESLRRLKDDGKDDITDAKDKKDDKDMSDQKDDNTDEKDDPEGFNIDKESFGKTVDEEGNKEVVKETKFIKDKDVGMSDRIPEELLGPTTKGSCTEVSFTVPLVNKKVKVLDFGECYDYRNALCKDSKCRCLKGQKLSKDGEYCIAPDVCTSHLSLDCGKVMGMFGGTCPGWSGAVCENDQCVCKEDSDKPCATLVTGYWAWKDYVPKCGTRKGETCIKNTLGSCMMAAAQHFVVDEIAGKIPLVGDLIAGGAKEIALQSKIPGNLFGERGNCFKWRDAICAPPVQPDMTGALGNTVKAGVHVIDEGVGTMCMCRPTDCAVWSKKHSGYTCVYSSLLTLDKAIVKDFESLTETIYSNITLALGGRGRDTPADFFEDKRDLLRQYPLHAACVRSMQFGSSGMKPGCKEFLCEFARSTTSSFHLANKECGLDAVPTMFVPGAILGISLLGLGVVACRVDKKKIMTRVTGMYINLDLEDTAASAVPAASPADSDIEGTEQIEKLEET